VEGKSEVHLRSSKGFSGIDGIVDSSGWICAWVSEGEPDAGGLLEVMATWFGAMQETFPELQPVIGKGDS
jgi:hypothetical protein